MEEQAIKQQGNNVLVRVKVKANANKFEIGKINRWRGRLKISVASAAKKGKANQELIDNLEERLGREVEVDSGHKSTKKLIRVKNCSKQGVTDQLLA